MSVKSFFQARWFLAALVVLALSPRTNGDIICNPGYTLVDDNCTMCVAGKHKQESGHMPCRSCPANSDSPAGSTAQGACKCNAGYSGDASAENPACTACSAGRYKTVNGSASCLSCPLYFNSPMGSASFADCIHDVAVLNVPFPTNSTRSSVKQYQIINKDQHMRFEYDSSYDNGSGQSEYILELRQDTTVSLLVVGGGGGGGVGAYESGGGGGGGIMYMVDKTLITGFYKIFVGSGGASGVTGYDSQIITLDGRSVIFDGLSVVGKGGGTGATCTNCPGQHGGSGGGGNKFGEAGGKSIQGNTFWNGSCYVAGGFDGESAGSYTGGGGGGSSEAGGSDGHTHGGDGRALDITGQMVFYGGGGAGGGVSTGASDGGGGGTGGWGSSGESGSPHTGGGGGGTYGWLKCCGGRGASGVVVLCFVNCPSGTFANTNTCVKCPAFSTSPAGSNSSTACSCNAGYGGNAGIPGGSCAACGAGTYREASGNVACTSCTSFSTSPSGSSAVSSCSCNAGYGGNAGTPGGSCIVCGAGKYKEASGNVACTSCTSFSNSPSGSSAVSSCSCNAGYGGNAGIPGGSCAACGAGTYKEASGNFACTNCTSFSTSPAGSSAVSSCSCNAGYGGNAATPGGSCAACGAGTYREASGNVACTSCTSFSTSPSGSSAVSSCSCNAGYGGNAGTPGGSCIVCGAGKYKEASGNFACTRCPAGTFSVVDGSTSLSICFTGGLVGIGAAVCAAALMFCILAACYYFKYHVCLQCKKGKNGSSEVRNLELSHLIGRATSSPATCMVRCCLFRGFIYSSMSKLWKIVQILTRLFRGCTIRGCIYFPIQVLTYLYNIGTLNTYTFLLCVAYVVVMVVSILLHGWDRANLLGGPSVCGFWRMYALWTPDIIFHAEIQRLFMPIFLHGHMLHLIMNLLGTLNVGLNAEFNWGIALNSNTEQGEEHAQRYERDLKGFFRWSTRNGSSKMLVVCMLSGLFGNISSAVADKIHMQTNPEPVLSVTVGASGSLCGLLGGEVAFLWSTWPYAESRCLRLSCILFDLVIISIVGGIFASHINNWVHLGGFLSGFCIGLFVHFGNFDGNNLLAARHHQVEYCEVSGVLVTSDQNMQPGGQDDQNIPSEISVDQISVETEQDALELDGQPGQHSGIIRYAARYVPIRASSIQLRETGAGLAASSIQLGETVAGPAASLIQLRETGVGLAASSIQLGETGAGLAESSIQLRETGTGLARSLDTFNSLGHCRHLSKLMAIVMAYTGVVCFGSLTAFLFTTPTYFNQSRADLNSTTNPSMPAEWQNFWYEQPGECVLCTRQLDPLRTAKCASVLTSIKKEHESKTS